MSKQKPTPAVTVYPSNTFVDIPIDLLVKAAWNYKQDDPALGEKLKANLKRNGQIENIIVRLLPTGFYEVVNGNHRYDEMLELGYQTAHCYNLGEISDAAAMRVAIETNETRFATDQMKLAERIREIALEFPLSQLEESMPFDEREMSEMMKMLNVDWDALNTKDPTDPSDSQDDADDENGMVELTLSVSPATLEAWNLLREASDSDDDNALLAFATASATKALGKDGGDAE